jgi:hypothetical protein
MVKYQFIKAQLSKTNKKNDEKYVLHGFGIGLTTWTLNSSPSNTLFDPMGNTL